jgi:hypothetical protein
LVLLYQLGGGVLAGALRILTTTNPPQVLPAVFLFSAGEPRRTNNKLK